MLALPDNNQKNIIEAFNFTSRYSDVLLKGDGNPDDYLRNRSAPTVNCGVIIHCLEVSCKEDQITSAQRE